MSRRARSNAVVYLQQAKDGWLSTRTGSACGLPFPAGSRRPSTCRRARSRAGARRRGCRRRTWTRPGSPRRCPTRSASGAGASRDTSRARACPHACTQRLHGDRDLQRRGRGEARPGVPGRPVARDQVLDEEGARPRERARERSHRGVEPTVPDARNSAGSCRARQPENVPDGGASGAAVGGVRRHPDRRVPPWQRDAEVEAAAGHWPDGERPLPTRTTTTQRPRGTRPATRPKEASRSAGATSASGGGGGSGGAVSTVQSCPSPPTKSRARAAPRRPRSSRARSARASSPPSRASGYGSPGRG